MARERLLVIGNGMAGARVVEEILDRDPDRFAITMFGDEPHGNYNRISLSNVLAGSEDPREIFLNPLEWYEENAITLHKGVRITAIDKYARVVTTGDGGQHPYDQLIIATGSRAFIPPVDGVWTGDGLRPGIFGFRTIADTHGMLAMAERRGKAIVIGGGLLGLEAARGLKERGCDVAVVHRSQRLMNVQLDDEAARILKRAVVDMGIEVHLGASTEEVLAGADGGVGGIRLKDGTVVDGEMVVFATGIRPNAELATGAGLEVERGIVVDDAMRAQDEDAIWVVGECAQHRGELYGLVAPLWEQAVVLADRITGVDPTAEYHGSKLATKLKVSGVQLAQMGIVEPEHEDDEVVRFSEPKRGVYKTVIVRDGKLVGAILLGDLGKVSFLMQSFDRGTVLPEERVELLFDLGGPPAEVSIEAMADDTQICNCNGVSKGDIKACVSAGRRTMRAVADATRAGQGCGSCKAQVLEVIEWAAGGELEDDPAADWYVPCIPMSKPELIAACREQDVRSVSGVFAAFATEEDPKAKPALASLLRLVWAGDYDDERDAKFINDRVHGNIQKDGTFSVVPASRAG